jgi:hypothetical protein
MSDLLQNPKKLLEGVQNPFRYIKDLLPDDTYKRIYKANQQLKEAFVADEAIYQKVFNNPDVKTEYVFTHDAESQKLKLEGRAIIPDEEGQKIFVFLRVYEGYFLQNLKKILEQAKSIEEVTALIKECFEQIKAAKKYPGE